MRYCDTCGSRLASDNPDLRCRPCQRRAVQELPEHFWDTDQMRDALTSKHLGKVIRAYRRSPHHPRPISQETMAELLGLSQTQVARIEGGSAPLDLGKLTRWAAVLGIPQRLLWFDLSTEPGQPHPATDGEALVSFDRRTLLRGALAGLTTAPTISLDDLRRLALALEDAHRYLDGEVVAFLQHQLDTCARADGNSGPRQTLMTVLGILGAIDNHVREVKPAVRRDLLGLGARAAEFAGWLYRDIGDPGTADYWRDRAIEWAVAAGDYAMQGYVLLKKSQAAWDDRDAVRMLTLAQAVQEGPWGLPRQVLAEAAQQQARGHAMLGEGVKLVERKLDEARGLFQEPDHSVRLGAHYNEVLFAMQTAICFTEADRPEHAIEIYRGHLTEAKFSHRDYGYFLSLMSGTFAAAGNPDEAATTGLRALWIAKETNSTRTARELLAVVTTLASWRDRPAVRELREAVLI